MEGDSQSDEANATTTTTTVAGAGAKRTSAGTNKTHSLEWKCAGVCVCSCVWKSDAIGKLKRIERTANAYYNGNSDGDGDNNNAASERKLNSDKYRRQVFLN